MKDDKKKRIDKILGNMGYGSRTEIKKIVKQGRVTLNGSVVKDSGTQCLPLSDVIEVDGDPVLYREFIYLMMHKPPGVISATEDFREKTVIDLIPDEYLIFAPFPVGRLDKDTEGLLLLTNDGQLAHDLLSPRKHVPKTYVANCIGHIGDDVVEKFKEGVELDDGYVTLPAALQVLEIIDTAEGEKMSRISLTISEGKFHQVKRMFESVGSKVTYLKRVSMGSLELDESLPMGSVRELTESELQAMMIHRDKR
ncbi:16S rRNA pseudouridine516 synthase [Fontibacillus solani]|uniref:Pseudouridine synthase n=1 Tax=Fontibacillus solani TaxID=1572857 RepID=A0A7W3SUE2_9BACL|nr:pseudouridine synthase [Fontibacillus solani]MBA9086349.1 16S rRNA pseudouridine516 synthase [Fontibacillus solani]